MIIFHSKKPHPREAPFPATAASSASPPHHPPYPASSPHAPPCPASLPASPSHPPPRSRTGALPPRRRVTGRRRPSQPRPSRLPCTSAAVRNLPLSPHVSVIGHPWPSPARPSRSRGRPAPSLAPGVAATAPHVLDQLNEKSRPKILLGPPRGISTSCAKCSTPGPPLFFCMFTLSAKRHSGGKMIMAARYCFTNSDGGIASLKPHFRPDKYGDKVLLSVSSQRKMRPMLCYRS